jgi:glycosyltransferase involved in cell wall biosynthesis
MDRTVFFVGPLPPPVHGFSLISQRMLAAIAKRFKVEVFNQTPIECNGFLGKLRDILRIVHQTGRFAVELRRNGDSVVYIALSGGRRQLSDFLFLAIGKVLHRDIYIHHHSFAYLTQSNPFTGFLLNFESGAKHLVLCDRMAHILSTVYGIDRSRLIKLSNSAFVRCNAKSPGKRQLFGNSSIKLGFLSNITPEKGILEFIKLVKTCIQGGIEVSAIVAGPVDSNFEDIFLQAISSAPEIAYWGPVYGRRKAEFFDAIDVLVFPSHYVNEAEPVIILEAASAGVTVIASGRGCMEEMLTPIGGHSISVDKDFCTAAVAVMRTWDDRRQLDDEKLKAKHGFFVVRRDALCDLMSLLDLMGAPPGA